MIEFTVAGVPAPQGSKVRTKWGMREDNPATRPWRQAVGFEALAAMKGAPPHSGPLRLEVVFAFPRPKSHYGTGKNADVLKAAAPTLHTAKPDVDKLVRAIGDAVTGVCCRDDSQFALVVARKIYGTPGARVTITPVDARPSVNVRAFAAELF